MIGRCVKVRLGRTCCRPKNPDCGNCPVSDLCENC
ncbi:MAG: hypothetical protein IKP04_02065 [Candidatus Methanomethylophilaceae archaeon]|nr:hypothetical protein [Candidatus Methanomethylophilaceae archaeon]